MCFFSVCVLFFGVIGGFCMVLGLLSQKGPLQKGVPDNHLAGGCQDVPSLKK